MAAVYAWCVGGGPAPAEIEAARLLDRFGVQAVYGRALSVREMRRIMLAERIEQVARRWKGQGAGQWFAAHPEDAALLAAVKKASKHGP